MNFEGKRNEIISILIVYLVVILFLTQSLDFIGDSGLFPKALSICVLILNTIQLIKLLRKEASKKETDDELDGRKLIYIFLMATIYIVTLKYLGFIIGSIIFLPITMYLLGVKDLKIIVLVTIGTVAVIYGSFGALLKVPIPKGFLGF